MNGNRIKILLIEDDAGDAFLIQEMLAGVTDVIFEPQWCRSLKAGIAYITSDATVDAVLLDLMLPDSGGLATLHSLKNANNTVPIIVLTGLDSEDAACEAVNKGAQDFLVKGRFNSDSLSRSIRYSIQRQKLYTDLTDMTWHLQMSEMRFRDIFENNADGIIIAGPDENIIMANTGACRLFGRSPEDLVGLPFGYPLGGESSSEIEILRPDGSIATIEMRTTRTIWDGRTAYLASLRDISERKLAEMQMRNLNAILNITRKLGRIILNESDTRRIMQGICNSFVEMRGYGSAWIVRTGHLGEFLDVFSAGAEADNQKLVSNWIKAQMPRCARDVLIHGGVQYLEEAPSECLDGHCPFNCRRFGLGSLSARLEYGGNVYGLLKISMPDGFVMHAEEKELFGEMADAVSFAVFTRENNTARAEHEKRLRQLAMMQDSQLENSGVWLNVIDQHGSIMVWNKTAEFISGYSSEEVVGRSEIWDWLYPDATVREGIVGNIRHVIKEGKGFDSLETVIRSRSGELRSIAWHLRNLSDDSGESIGAIMLGRDVTDHRQAEDDLRRTTQWLKRGGLSDDTGENS